MRGNGDKHGKGTKTMLQSVLFFRGGEGVSPTFIKSAAKESAFREKGTEKATENHKLGRTIGVDKLREEREMGTWSRVGFKDRKKLIVGRGESGRAHAQPLSQHSLT